jgi:hypothetical protein
MDADEMMDEDDGEVDGDGAPAKRGPRSKSDPEKGGGGAHGKVIDMSFLHPDKIKDKQGRRPGHPEYDPRTVHVPLTVLNTMSPGQRQYWEIKSENFDVVLLFKQVPCRAMRYDAAV